MKSPMVSAALLALLVVLPFIPAECNGWSTVLSDNFQGPINIASATDPPTKWSYSLPAPSTPTIVEHAANGRGLLASVVPYRTTVAPGPLGFRDHAKFGIQSDTFSIAKNQSLKLEATIGGAMQGNAAQPFGPEIDVDDDPRTGNVNFSLLDSTNFILFGFVLSNKGIYVFLDRIPFTGFFEGGPELFYQAFSWGFKVAPRVAGESHRIKIVYNRNMGKVYWYLEGKKVFSISKIGLTPDRENTLRYYTTAPGVTEYVIDPESLRFAFGSATRLDNREWSKSPAGTRVNNKGLVQTIYNKPELGYKFPTEFVFDGAAAQDNHTRLWGVGGNLIVYKVKISRRDLE